MINPNEIRLGNWFHHNESWSYRNNDLKAFNFQWEERDWYALAECTLFLENISSIPVTESILEEMGFESGELPDELVPIYFDEDCVFSVELIPGFLGIKSRAILSFYDYSVDETGEMGRSCAYEIERDDLMLHQLQDIYYWMTGKELTLKQ